MGEERAKTERFNNTAARVCACVLLLLLTERLLKTLLSGLAPSGSGLIFVYAINIASYALAFVTPFLVLRGGDGGIKGYLAKPRKTDMLRPIVMFGGCCFLATAGQTAADRLTVLFKAEVKTSAFAGFSSPAEFIFAALYLVLLPAILEELLFRGLILQRLRVFGDEYAVAASALLFACIHADIPRFAGIFAMGVLLGALRIRTESCRYTVLLHMLNNAAAFFLDSIDAVFGAGTADLVFGVATIIFAVCAAVAAVWLIRAGFFKRTGKVKGLFKLFANPAGILLAAYFILGFIERLL